MVAADQFYESLLVAPDKPRNQLRLCGWIWPCSENACEPPNLEKTPKQTVISSSFSLHDYHTVSQYISHAEQAANNRNHDAQPSRGLARVVLWLKLLFA